MKQKLALIATIACSITSAFAAKTESNPWANWSAKVPPKISSAYAEKFEAQFQKYNSTFGTTVRGFYGVTQEEAFPSIAGGLISFQGYIPSDGIIHQISLSTGYFGGEHVNGLPSTASALGLTIYEARELIGALNLKDATMKMRTTGMPLLLGYEINIFNTDTSEPSTTCLYLSVKSGFSFNKIDVIFTGYPYHEAPESIKFSENSTDFTVMGGFGFKFGINENSDFVIGYELLKIQNIKPYHVFIGGFSFNF